MGEFLNVLEIDIEDRSRNGHQFDNEEVIEFKLYLLVLLVLLFVYRLHCGIALQVSTSHFMSEVKGSIHHFCYKIVAFYMSCENLLPLMLYMEGDVHMKANAIAC